MLQGTVVSKRLVGRHVLFISLSDHNWCAKSLSPSVSETVDVLLKSSNDDGGSIPASSWLELKRCVRVGDVLDVEVGAEEKGGKGCAGNDIIHAITCTIQLMGDKRGTPAAAAGCSLPLRALEAHGNASRGREPKPTESTPQPNHHEVIQLLLGCGAADQEAMLRSQEDARAQHQSLQEPSLPMPTEAQFAVSAMHCAERSKVFAFWAIQKYYNNPTIGGKGVILDVAGGVGQLSLLFALSGIPARLVDPRGGILPKRQRKQLRRSGLAPFERNACLFGAAEATTAKLLRGVSFVLGLHPDEATDFIVDAAIAAQVPFAVVPCCCFSRLFPHRRLKDGSRVGTSALHAGALHAGRSPEDRSTGERSTRVAPRGSLHVGHSTEGVADLFILTCAEY